MPSLRFILLLPFALIFASFLACTDNSENFSTNPDDRLAFSADTISFDTILSTVNTPTLGFMVYNPNNKPLLIASVDLSAGGQSGFKINVDGVSGTHFENVEIGAKDSLYVYVNVKLDENNQVIPVLHQDYIVFTTNAVQQKIVLEAYGRDVYIWHGKVIETSETLPNDKPYLIYDSLEVRENAILTIQEGTVFYMHSSAFVRVKGALMAKGHQDRRIVIRGDRMDNDYMINIPYDRVPGQWGGIRFTGTSYGNEMEYVWIRNSSYGLAFDRSDPEQSKLKIRNSIITNVTENLIIAENCNIEGENCEFSNSRNALMYLAGGKYSFTHCTMANCYASARQWGYSNNPTLTLTNKSYDADTVSKKLVPVALPLLQADFLNSIVWSPNSQSGGIQLQKDSVDFPGTTFSYYFQNSLVLYNGKVNDWFPGCIFNKDPHFINTRLTDDDKKSIPYDFRLDSISPARNVADPVIAQKIPVDMNGISRFQDTGPDMGTYEYENKK